MQEQLVVVLDGKAELQYHHDKSLSDQQIESLAKMDQMMDGGIVVDNARIENPTPVQRARFVAEQLFAAILTNNESVAAATLAYLANRLPGLKQVRGNQSSEGLAVDLVFDKPYTAEAKVEFIKPMKH